MLGILKHRQLAELEVDHVHDARRLRGLEHLVAVVRIHGHGLFAEHRFARGDGRHDDVVVQGGGRGDADGVDRRISDQLLPAGKSLGNAELLGRLLGTFRVSGSNADDLASLHQTKARHMHRCAESRADDAYADSDKKGGKTPQAWLQSGKNAIRCYNPRMHIVILNDDVLIPGFRGGVAVVVDMLRRAYTKLGHKVTLITTHQKPGEDEIRWSDENGEVISIAVRIPMKGLHRRSASVTDVSPRVRKLLAEIKPDAVHAHNIHVYLTYDVLNVAKEFTDSIALTIHDTFLVSFARVGGPRYEEDLKRGRPHRLHWWNHLLMIGREYWPLRNWKIKKILKQTGTKVVVYSHAMESLLNANGIKTFFGRSGLEERPEPSQEEIQEFQKRHGFGSPAILYGGRLSGDKGLDALLNMIPLVLDKIPNATFLVIGDSKRAEPHLAKAPERVRSAIKLLPWLDYEEMQIAYRACDLITTPSLYLDNFPTINLEAMRAGRPVVGTCFGGTPEAVIDGQTGFIVNPRDVRTYADRIVQLLQDPKLRETMGKAGQERIRTSFDVRKQAESYINLLTS